jgi:signal transduction histidine kinase
MSIRRKLFFAFVAAAALPLLAMGVLARLYLQRARVDVEQRFVDHARQAARAMSARAGDRTEILKAALQRLGQEGFGHVPAPPLPPPELHIFHPGWVETPEGQVALHKAQKANEAGRSAATKIIINKKKDEVRIEALIDPWDDDDLEAQVKRFRLAHPPVLGVKLVVDGEVVMEDLPHPADPAPTPELAPNEQRTWIFSDGEDHHYLVWTRDGNTTRIVVEIDPAMMLEPMNVAGVRAFYLTRDGRARHCADTARDLATDLPLLELARAIPSGGGSAQVTARGQKWRVYAAVSADRDDWNYGGQARLVAVAPESLIEEPLLHFRAEVLAAGLLSLLVAVGLSYFLSGRFSESVDNLKRGVDALSRGEFAHLEKSSGDELGGELVESMNRMASALAERTRKEEIEGWRRLVRVLSHEINNTLGPVKSVASTVRDQLAPRLEGETGDDLKSAFKLIVDRVDSLSSFISGYAVLAKLPPPERAPVELNELVRGAVSMLKAKMGNDAAVLIDEDYDPEVGMPLVDQQQLERVAINLVKNAAEAAASSVWVKTVRRGDTVELQVEDDGPGIAAEARGHLFVPYYTTKPGGSGIGLALARQIVLGHGGTIGTRDRDGGGTIVFVILPSS